MQIIPFWEQNLLAWKMAKTKHVSKIAITILLASVSLAACQSNKGLKDKAPAYVERPVELLYNNARDLVSKRDYAEAVNAFDEVDRQHPYSEWARRSILMSAYSSYAQNKYEDAIEAANRYSSMYQGGSEENSAYAYYLIAICYFEQIVDVGRDQRMTELALASLNELVQRYPNTAYAKDARLKMDMTRDQLAGKEMEIGRYYLSQDQHLAAIGRFKRVVDIYQTTSHTPEALHRLVESYLSMGLIDEATKIGAVLGYNYPGSEWYEKSYKLLTSKGINPKEKPKRRLFEKKQKAPKTIAETKGSALMPQGI